MTDSYGVLHSANPMASTSTIYPLVDRILDGHLAANLAEWRGAGKSYEDIAYILRSEHGVKVSQATVCRWINADPAGSAPKGTQ